MVMVKVKVKVKVKKGKQDAAGPRFTVHGSKIRSTVRNDGHSLLL